MILQITTSWYILILVLLKERNLEELYTNKGNFFNTFDTQNAEAKHSQVFSQSSASRASETDLAKYEKDAEWRNV